jgi:cytochrome c5
MTEELHVEAHQSFIKTPAQLVVVILASFLVPIAIIVAISQYMTSGLDTSPSNPLMAEDAVAKRIKPAGEVVLGEAPPPAPAAPPAASAAAGPADGKAVYDKACAACHGAGVMNSPKAGDKGAWGPRIAQGKPTLYEHALKGIRMMPAKGGNAALSDNEVKAAVDHMVGLAK